MSDAMAEIPTLENPLPTEDKQADSADEASDEEPPSLEAADNPDIANFPGGAQKRQSRSEKKIRKALQKVGLKTVPGIMKVTVKKGKSILFVIQSPDVYKSPSQETYVIFGEAKIEDLNNSALQTAAENFTSTPGVKDALADEEPPALIPSNQGQSDEKTLASSTTSAAESVDETGLNAKDIELVMSQGNVGRATAVKALRAANGDIVTAIMELTMNQ